MIKKLSLLLLAGCVSNQGLSTMSTAQENIWNLSRICLGMNQDQVRRIMHEPYRTKCFTHNGLNYLVWFYVTRPAALGQRCLIKINVTPVVFENGLLIGWGYDVYDCLMRDRARYYGEPGPGETLQDVIQEMETAFLSQNQTVEEEPCDCPVCKPKKPPLDEEDDRMIEEANDQNFNFW